MALTQSSAIEIKRVKGKGRGVFARRLIRRDEVIEKVPVIVLPLEEFENGLSKTRLANYCFDWAGGTVALALGYGSMYNHSYRPNARYEDVSTTAKAFRALRDIKPGEEITVNYNGEPKKRAAVWFDVVEDGPQKGVGARSRR